MTQNLESTLQGLETSFNQFKENQQNRFGELESKLETKSGLYAKDLIQRPDVSFKAENHQHGFLNYVRQGVTSFHHKSMMTSVDASGGYLVPDHVSSKIMETLETLSPIRSLAMVEHISTSSLDILQDRNEPGVGWVGETEDRPETATPELDRMTIQVHEIYAKPRCTQKLLDDAKINVEEWLIHKISDKIARTETQAFIHGNGDKKPKGFLTYECAPSDDWEWGKIEQFFTGADGAFAEKNPGDVLIDTLQSMKPMYLNDAAWIMSRSTLAALRRLKNEFADYMFQPGLSLKAPSTLLGYPVIICDDMPPLIPGEVSNAIVFANFKEAYRIVDRSDLYVLRDPYSAKPYVEFYTTKRVGGDVVNFEAIKVVSFASCEDQEEDAE